MIRAILSGKLPTKPSQVDIRSVDVDDFYDLWRLCEYCWARDPGKRPSMLYIQSYFMTEHPSDSSIYSLFFAFILVLVMTITDGFLL